MSDDRNTQTVYASLQADIDRLTKRNEEINVKLDNLNAQLMSIPFGKMDKKRQVKNQINSLEKERSQNSRYIDDRMNEQKRLQIVDERNETKQTAYQNGIDPNAAWANATASGLGSVASVVGSLSGAGVFSGIGGKKPSDNVNNTPPTPTENNTPKTSMYLMIGAAILVLLMIMKKK